MHDLAMALEAPLRVADHRWASQANEDITRQRRQKYQKFMVIIYLIILVWALLLAMQTKGDKVVHIALALIVPPVYIIAHYIGANGDK